MNFREVLNNIDQGYSDFDEAPGQKECDWRIYSLRRREVRSAASILANGLAGLAADLRTMPYEQFLLTDYWQEVRRHVIHLRGNKCERCRERGRVDVHHKTYENRGLEYWHLEDLELLCASCHKAQHGIR